MTRAEITRPLEAMCRVVWGFAPRMIEHIVLRLGPGRSMLWIGGNMPRALDDEAPLLEVRSRTRAWVQHAAGVGAKDVASGDDAVTWGEFLKLAICGSTARSR